MIDIAIGILFCVQTPYTAIGVLCIIGGIIRMIRLTCEMFKSK